MDTVHYIAMAGLHGCMPCYCASCDTFDDAVGSLTDTYDLSKRLARELRDTESVELSLHKHGVEYAEIIPCDCDTPSDHNDD